MEGCVTFFFLLIFGIIIFTIWLPDNISTDTTWEEGKDIIEESGGWGWAAFCVFGAMFVIFTLGKTEDKIQELPADRQNTGVAFGLVLTIILILSYCIIAQSEW